MEFRVLGPLEVVGPQGPITIGSGLQRAALAILVLHIGETVSTERLIDELWGDDPPRGAQHALEVHVSGLRRLLGTDRIDTRPNGYRLRAEGGDVDLAKFEMLVAEASRAFANGDPGTAAAGFATALALWRGPALGDLARGAAASAERTRLDELRALALERRIDADLATGRHADVVPELRRIVAEMPLREAFHARLMLALYRSGRQAEALDVYLRARNVLDRELGVEPGPELESLQRAVLDHDPDLAAAPVPMPHSQIVGPPAATSNVAAVRRASRRIVTTLMADISGSTLLGEPIDPETARQPIDRWLGETRATLVRHGGTVQEMPADTVVGIFGAPVAREDDPLRAVRAAVEMRVGLDTLNEVFARDLAVRFEMRVGVNTGEVVAGEGPASGALVTGDAVNVAARLQQAAAPGQIVIGEPTLDRVRDAVDVGPAAAIEIGGRAGPILGYEVRHLTGSQRSERRLDAPMVGRAAEFDTLRQAFERTLVDQSCHLVTILGAAGVGKSRLAAEFLLGIEGRALVLRGRCLPYGDGITYWPVAEVVRQFTGIQVGDSAETARQRIALFVEGSVEAGAIARGLAGIIGLESDAGQEDLFWAFRRACEQLADERPLVVVIEDIHWAEPTLLDLLESVAELGRDTPVLLLCPARPELLDDRPSWGSSRRNATTILLETLNEASALQLIDSLVPGGVLPAAARARIIEATEGNPLFVEEFLAMLVDERALVVAGDGWTATRDIESIPVPPTIQALLATRLDRLSPDERAVAERAAVIGRVFDQRSVLALSPEGRRSDVPRSLVALVRKGLIRPERGLHPRGETFRFRHVLIREAAYEGLPKAGRAELHEVLADSLEQAAGDRLSEVEELIGFHLEQSNRYRSELAPLDERTRGLARRAAEHLIAAGRRAFARSDVAAAANLLGRGAALLEPGDPRRLAILTDLALALAQNGRPDEAKACFAEAIERSAATGDEQARAFARVLQHVTGNAGPDISADENHRVAAEAIGVFERTRDDRGLAFAWHLHAAASNADGQLADQEAALLRALAHARRAGDHQEETYIAFSLGVDLAQGPTPIPEAIRRCNEILDHAPDDRAIEMAMSHALAHLHARLGEFETARVLAARCRDIAVANGQLGQAAFLTEVRWDVEMLAGDPGLAEEVIAQGCAEYEAIGQRGTLLEPLLVQSQVALRHPVDLERLARAAGGHTGWIHATFQLAAAAAEVKAGHLEEALHLATTAVDVLGATDFVSFHADATVVLGDVHVAAGRSAEAESVFQAALDLYRRKGNVVGERTAAARLADASRLERV